MHGGLIETTYDASESNVVGTDEIAKTIQDLLEGLSEILDNTLTNVKEGLDNKTIAQEFVHNLQEELNNPDSPIHDKLTEEQKALLQEQIDNGELEKVMVVAAEKAREQFKNGEADQVIKEGLASHLVNPDTMEDPIRQEDLINYEVLVKWIKENYGKSSVAYNPEQFIVPSKLQYFYKLDKLVQLAYSVPFTTPEGKKLHLEGSLSLEEGTVDLSTIYMVLELELNEKHQYTDIIKYANDKTYKETDAIRLTVQDVKDYEAYTDFTGLDFNKDYVLEQYNKEFTTAGTDCNKIDFLYEHAPDFVLESREETLWEDLKQIASCSVDERGTDEEFVVLKLIEAIGRNKGADALLQGLLERKLEGESLFKTLYEKMHNYGGEDNFTAYIQTLYKYWVVSSYNNFERYDYEQVSDVIPYKSAKDFGFYFDDEVI